MAARIIIADVLDGLATLEAGVFRCCVTSPPYWGLRDYGQPGQIGLERTPGEFVARMVGVFREVRRVLADDGTLWLNLGDSFNAYNGGAGPGSGIVDGPSERSAQRPQLPTGYGLRDLSLKPKDMVGIPWRVALALQADGWWLRSDIIWHKPNPMPESITDRPTKAHEYLFLLAKSARYYYDAEAIAEPRITDGAAGAAVAGWASGPGSHTAIDHARERTNEGPKFGPRSAAAEVAEVATTRNRRSVWTIPVQPFPGAHFATYPVALVEPCILAGSARGDAVLDPFAGAGTTGLVADRLGRDFVGVELNAKYAEIARARIAGDAPLFADVAVQSTPEVTE